MKFRALPITNLEDATLDFEQLQTRAILDKLPIDFLQLVSSKLLAVDAGHSTATFTASALSATVAVSHGLGRAPVALMAAGNDSGTGIWWNAFQSGTPTTTLSVNAVTTAAISGTFNFSWLVIG